MSCALCPCAGICCCYEEIKAESEQDLLTNILIFGVTGMVGGAVLEACVNSVWFRISGFTRAEEDDFFMDFFHDCGIQVKSGDMLNYTTVLEAMEDQHVVFLNTHYWEHMSVEMECEQANNVVKAAMLKGVRHLIYIGTDYQSISRDEKCRFLEGKAKIENYIVNSGIPYTIVRLGFCFENFLGVFKPHCIGKNRFALAFPMEDRGLNMGSVLDFGLCLSRIALRSKKYVYKTVMLSSGYYTLDEIVDAFNEHLGQSYAFTNPHISLSEYRSLDFEGSEDLRTMWLHYQNCGEWSVQHLKTLMPKAFGLNDFIRERKNRLTTMLEESEQSFMFDFGDEDLGDLNMGNQINASPSLFFGMFSSKQNNSQQSSKQQSRSNSISSYRRTRYDSVQDSESVDMRDSYRPSQGKILWRQTSSAIKQQQQRQSGQSAATEWRTSPTSSINEMARRGQSI